MLAATISTMVVFALERANADILLFILALVAVFLAERGSAARLLGYCVALLAALLKYYPIMLLIMVFPRTDHGFPCRGCDHGRFARDILDGEPSSK